MLEAVEVVITTATVHNPPSITLITKRIPEMDSACKTTHRNNLNRKFLSYFIFAQLSNFSLECQHTPISLNYAVVAGYVDFSLRRFQGNPKRLGVTYEASMISWQDSKNMLITTIVIVSQSGLVLSNNELLKFLTRGVQT